jgi:agmatinase/guanidinopropionase
MSKIDFMPLSGRVMPRFGGIKTFFRLPVINIDEESSNELDVAIFGLPFDGTVSYRPGARFGPSKISEISSLGRGYHLSRDESVFGEINVADVGDCSVVPMSVEKTYELIEKFDQKILNKKKRFLSVGGDHSTTLGHLRALKSFYGEALTLIHFDAHLDTYPPAWGCEYHHGAFVRHAVNEGLIDTTTSIQIGIRGPLAGREDLDFNHKHNLKYTTVDDVRKNGVFEFCKSLSAFDSKPTFISFDIDCLDPSCAPGTGTPVPGGLNTYETQKILQSLKINNLVGADLVEVSPPYDQSDITALAGVDVCFELLCLMKKSVV